MSIVFDLAEAINLLYGVILGEATPSIINKLKELTTQKQIKDKLLLIVGNDRNLPDKVKEDLTILVKDSQFITTFLRLAVEINAGSSDSPSIPSDDPGRENIEQRWDSITSCLDETTKAMVWENFRTAIIEEVIKTLSPADQHMHYLLSYLQIRMDQLQQTVQQDVAQQAAIDELRALIDGIHTKIAGQMLGSLSVDDRVNQYFSLRDSLIPAVFMGRENEIDQINKFILEDTENCDQWWWWQADAWAGKTALMAHLASNPKPDVNVASVFIIGREPANADSDAFYSYLIPQLAKIAGLTWVEIPSDLQGRIAQLKNLIDAAAASSRPNNGRLIIMVDGLDEDQGPYRETTRQSIAASLPNSLPTNVRVIISSRHNPPLPIDVPDSHPLQDPRYRHPLEISEYAKAAKKSATDELKRIIKINDGSNRYGRDMLAFMAASGGWLTGRDLAKLTKQDIYSIVEILEENATARSFRINHLSDGNLAYAMGHDLLDQLLVCEYLDEQIRPPLDQSIDDQIKAYRAKYEKDRARYENDRYIALQPWRQKIAKWAEEYNDLGWPSSTPEYLCSEAFADLISRDPDLEKQALSILTNQSRINLLQSKHGNDYQAITQLQFFIDTLSNRITSIPSDSLTYLATALHFLERLSQRTWNIPPKLPAVFALLGRSEFAETLALSISKRNARISALCQLAIVLAQSNDTTRAKKIAELALSTTNAISTLYDKAEALIEVTSVLAQFGSTDEIIKKNISLLETLYTPFDSRGLHFSLAGTVTALAQSDNIAEATKLTKTIMSNMYPEEKAQALGIITSTLVQSGKITEATNFANAIIDPDDKARTLAMIATTLALSGDTAQANKIAKLAINTANDIKVPYSKARTLAMIATTLALSGDTAQANKIAKLAINTVNDINDPHFKAHALVEIATAITQSSNSIAINKVSELAPSIVNAIRLPSIKARTLAQLANSFAQSGNIKEAKKFIDLAIKTANGIGETDNKDYALAGIVTTLTQSNNITEASNLAFSITAPYYKDQALAAIATSFAKSRNTAGAMNIVKFITDSELKAQVLKDIAVTVAESENITEATNFADLITDLNYKAQAFTDIAITVAKFDNNIEAINIASLALIIANAIVDPYSKVKDLAEVADALVQFGNTKDAKKIIDLALINTNSIPNSYDKIRALVKVATAFGKSNKSDEAIEIIRFALFIANDISDSYKKTHARAEVATALANLDITNEANKIVELILDIANDISESYEKTGSLTEVVIALVKSSKTTEAIKIANAISNPYVRAQVLIAIASVLVQTNRAIDISIIVELALKNANAISSPDNKAEVLVAIANILVQSGNVTEANRTVELALKNANAISYPDNKAEVLVAIANALAQSGKTTDANKIAELALNTANNITDPVNKAQAFAEIATVYAKMGRSAEATKMAKFILDIETTIKFSFRTSFPFANLAIALAQLGISTEAIMIADIITNPTYKARALSTIAFEFVRTDKSKELALSTADSISDTHLRAETLGKLAIEFFRLGLDELKAKATVGMLLSAKNPWKYYDVFLKVAEPSALAILPLLLEETED